uniref:HMG box domain-containing protein n=1 Tax=Angiostrongylus cantonensis TaxID=6313 RepID=A0A0K0DE20_ANGCA
MKEDQMGRQECERELGELEKAFLKKMEEFLSNHRDVLLPKQTEFVEHKIKLMRKKIFPSQRNSKVKSNKPPNGSQVMQEKTAFDLFCSTKMDKYIDRPAEVRLKKLRKKFDKLPDDKKEIFEKLAQIR